MKFYTKQHKFYCRVDLHAKTMYICIIDKEGSIVKHKNISADADAFLHYVSMSSRKHRDCRQLHNNKCAYWLLSLYKCLPRELCFSGFGADLSTDRQTGFCTSNLKLSQNSFFDMRIAVDQRGGLLNYATIIGGFYALCS